MNNKIQELTDIIYNEGVVKGQAEAEKVLADAKAQAEQILAEAKAQADSIVEAAKKSAAEMSENTTKELKLYASQALNALKSEVASVVTDTIVKEEVSGFVSQKDYLNQFIVQLASKWAENEQIVISVADAEELKKYFMSKAKELLDKGVEIKFYNIIAPKRGFVKGKSEVFIICVMKHLSFFDVSNRANTMRTQATMVMT